MSETTGQALMCSWCESSDCKSPQMNCAACLWSEWNDNGRNCYWFANRPSGEKCHNFRERKSE